VISEIERLLKKGGRLMLITPNYPIKRLYDIKNGIIKRDFKRILFDHPTHQTYYNFSKLNQLLTEYFSSVTLYPAYVMFEDRIPFLKKIKFLSHKIFEVCVK
jgi:SAM-dependent methyltransferase